MRTLGGMSLGCVLPALGVRLVLVEDPEALARIGSRLVKRKASAARHSAPVSFQFSRRHMQRIGRIGGTNSRKHLTRERVTELASKAGKAGAKARWGRQRQSNGCA
jgi:hypothetical protein